MSLISERADASPVPLITSANETISFKPDLGCYIILYPGFRPQHTFLMMCNVMNTVTDYNRMLNSYKTVQLIFI